MREWSALHESGTGERGIFNRKAAQLLTPERRESEHDFGTNPCSEIVLRNKQFCNLTEIVVRNGDTKEDLIRKAEIATILGTLQSTLVDFRYLTKAWSTNTSEERLLGVSMTGIMDHEVLSKVSDESKEWLSEIKNKTLAVNKKFAKMLDIPASTAITCVKPSGTVSQLTNTASGLHPRYAEFYIRTVRQDVKDPLAAWMLEMGFPAEPDLFNPQNLVFSFPQKGPHDAVMRDDMSAIEQLEHWKMMQTHYCEHKPSITVYVREHEWMEVGAWVYENFNIMSGVSFLPYSGGVYAQAPYQEITEEEYNEWMERVPHEVDFDTYTETDDNTVGMQELACSAGGVCEI
jgi:ribonucleoside-diphosphate reductase alpha chain